MKKFKKYLAFFSIGGVGYAIIELLWRRRTHLTMLFAGGICFIIFSVIARDLKIKNILPKALLCALSITAVELVFGLIFNLGFKMNVWDYSSRPLNFLGQICPQYSLLWALLALLFLPLANLLNERMDEKKDKSSEEYQRMQDTNE